MPEQNGPNEQNISGPNEQNKDNFFTTAYNSMFGKPNSEEDKEGEKKAAPTTAIEGGKRKSKGKKAKGKRKTKRSKSKKAKTNKRCK